MSYPRDNAPAPAPPAAEVGPIEYGTWEMLREGKECAILAVGVMCQPAMEAAETLAAEGIDVSVVNCWFVKPIDDDMFESLVQHHRFFVTVEDATRVNGFGSVMAARVDELGVNARVAILGAPDRTYEHASRSAQLASVGLDAEGIADRVRALAAERSYSTT